MKIIIIAPHFPCPDVYKERSLDPRSYFLMDYAKAWVDMGHQVTVIHTPPRYPIFIKLISSICDFLPIFKVNPIKRFLRDEEAVSKNIYVYENIDIYRVSVFKLPRAKKSSSLSLLNCIKWLESSCFPRNSEFDLMILDYVEPSFSFSKELNNIKCKQRWCILHDTDISYIRSDVKRFGREFSQINRILYRNIGIRKEVHSLVNAEGFPHVREDLIPSGIPDNTPLGCPRNSKVTKFIFVGRLVEYKNIDMILRSLSVLKLGGISFSFTIIGDGPLRPRLEAMVKELGLDPFTSFLGNIPHQAVFAHMRNSDAMIMVSKETFGMVYIEAMSQGCLVVGAKNYGVDGIVTNGINGFLVELGNQGELNKVLCGLCTLSEVDVKRISTAAIETTKKMTNSMLAADLLNRGLP